MEILVFVY